MYHVVVVDDEKTVQKILTQYIGKQADFEVAGAFKTGLQAWEYLQNEEVDILITDIRMPGMDGMELATKVIERWPDTAVGIFTGYSEFVYAQQAIRLGISCFLLKPINLEEFGQSLHHLAQQRQNHLQNRILQLQTPQDMIDDFLSDLQEGTILPQKRTERFRACGFPFSENRCHGKIIEISVALHTEKLTVETGANAITNILRMSFPSYIFFQLAGNQTQVTFLIIYSIDQPEWTWTQAAEALNKYLRMPMKILSEQRFKNLDELQKLLISTRPYAHNHRQDEQLTLIQMAKQYVDEHYHEDITRDDVAKKLYLNTSYFGRLFKQKTGETFGDYLIKIRMQKAIELLFSSCSVSEISTMVGYSNQSSFTRMFRFYTSYTPTEYRRHVIRRGDE